MKYLGKHFAGKKGTQLFIILFSLLIFVIGVSTFFSIPSILREGAVGSSQLEQPSAITSVSDVKNLPGVGKNPIGNANKESWSMINEIVEPDGTVVQDIVNTDGTVLTITNKQNIIKDRKSTRLNSSHTDISRMPSSA